MEGIAPKETDKFPDQTKNNSLMKYQFLYLHMAGVIPSIETEKSPWKLTLYNIYSIAMFVVGIPSTTLMFAKIIEIRDDIDVVAGLLFLDFGYLNHALTGFYYLTHRNDFKNVLLSLETILSPEMRTFASTSLQNKYIDKTIRYANKLLGITTVIITSSFIPWVIIPVIFTMVNIIIGDIDRNDESLDYVVYQMWVPQNFTEAPMLELVIAFKSFSFFSAVMTYGTTVTSILIVSVYLTSYFIILRRSIEDDESLFPEEMHESQLHEVVASARTTETSSDVEHEERYKKHLKECIQFHQKLIE